MAKTYHTSNRWALTGLFKRINLGDDPKLLRNEACHLAQKVNSDDIAAAQQALVDEGYSSQLVQKISAAFMLMGLRKKNSPPAEPKLPANHILEKIFAEHALTRCYLEDLIQVSGQIETLDHLTDVSSQFRRLSQIVEYLIQAKKQIEREDDLIFPYLKKFGWKGLSHTAQDDHRIIKTEIDNLTILVTGFDTIGLEKFNSWLPLVVKRLCPFMLNHISYEQEILWPIALIVIDDVSVWETIKALSDDFEY
jgi:DUF438 domain-containing protein